MAGQWPAHKASYVLRILRDGLGYKRTRQAGGERVVLTAEGRPTILWNYNNKQIIAPRELRRILLERVKLSEADAKALLAAQPGGRRVGSIGPSAEQSGGTYIARTRPDFLDTLERLPGRVPARWRAPDGRLFEYDQLHGNIEGYTSAGNM